jgi:hypothetical protein
MLFVHVMRAACFILLIALCPWGAASSGQSLAVVAKQEEERRKVVTPGKVYTNNDLTRDASSPPSPAASNASPAAPATPDVPSTQVPSVNLPGGTAETEPVLKDEAYWRTRIGAARSALERNRIFADALQSRLNALATDIVNRDDPAQRAQLELERQRALAELERVKKEMAEHTAAIAAVEQEARKAGVPPGWLR